MRKIVCSGVVQELKELLGDQAANDVICGLMNASDGQLIELRRSVEAVMAPFRMQEGQTASSAALN